MCCSQTMAISKSEKNETTVAYMLSIFNFFITERQNSFSLHFKSEG